MPEERPHQPSAARRPSLPDPLPLPLGVQPQGFFPYLEGMFPLLPHGRVSESHELPTGVLPGREGDPRCCLPAQLLTVSPQPTRTF